MIAATGAATGGVAEDAAGGALLNGGAVNVPVGVVVAVTAGDNAGEFGPIGDLSFDEANANPVTLGSLKGFDGSATGDLATLPPGGLAAPPLFKFDPKPGKSAESTAPGRDAAGAVPTVAVSLEPGVHTGASFDGVDLGFFVSDT